MIVRIYCCVLFVGVVNGMMLFKGGVRALISTHAVMSSILDEVVGEVLDRPLIMHEFEGFTTNHIDYFYFGCVLTSISLYLTYHAALPLERFYELGEFRNISRCVRVFAFVFMIIFIKNLENAI
jgi:hypothetical protein